MWLSDGLFGGAMAREEYLGMDFGPGTHPESRNRKYQPENVTPSPET